MKIGDKFVASESPNTTQPRVKEGDLEIIEKAKKLNNEKEELTDEQKQLEALDPQTRKFVEENQGIGGSLRVGAEQAGNQALFGVPEILYNHFADPQDVKEHEALKNFHQTANVVGGVAGALGSLAIGGPLFQTATKAGRLAEGAVLGTEAVTEGASFARALAAKAIGGAAEGAVIGAPKAAAEAVFGDPKEAAENLLFSAGVGGLIGPAAFASKKIAGAASEALLAGSEASENKLSSLLETAEDGSQKVTEEGREKITELIGDGLHKAGKIGGFAHGGPLGYIKGEALGALAEQAVKQIPDEYLTAGLQATLKANKLATKYLSQVPEILDTLSSGSFAPVASAAPSVFGSLGKGIANEADEYKAFQKFSEKLAANQATQNDQKIIGNNAAGLAHNLDVQSQYSQSALNAVNYLNTIIPKNPNPILPFSKNEWKPSENQLHDFHSALQIYNNPYIVLNKLHDGTLNKTDVTTLQTIYPATYSKIQQNIMSQASKEKYQNMPYGAKTKLAILTGMPIDSTFDPKFIQSMQADFAIQAQQEAPKNIKSLDHIGTPPPKNQRINAGLISQG